jgi:hypothetical protein
VLAAAGAPPEQVLFVGDNLQCDVTAPLAHGMRAALVRPSGTACFNAADPAARRRREGGPKPPDRPDRRRPGPGPSAPARLAHPVDRAAALVERMVQRAPPRQLQALIDSVAAGCGLHLYIPN